MTPTNNFDNLKKDSEALVEEGKLEEAAELLEKMVSHLERPDSANRDEMISALESLGACYFGMQDYDKTVSVYSRLVINLDEKFGMDHLETIKAVYKLAKSCEKAGQREQAQTMYYVARESAQKTLHEGHYLRQSIIESYHAIARPKRVVESVNAFVVGDLHDPKEVVKAAKSLGPAVKKALSRINVVVSLLCTVTLIAAGGIWMSFEATKRNAEKAAKAEAVAPAIAVRDARTVNDSNTFFTTDRLITLRFFNDKEGEIACGDNVVKLPVVTLNGSFDSFLKMYERGGIDKRAWAEVDNGVLKLSGGTQLFANNSIDLKLADACEEVGKRLNEYYKKNNSYPDLRSDMVAGGKLTYINPLTGKPQVVKYQNFSQYMQLSHMFDGCEKMEDVVKFLKAGGRWIEEPSFSPGDIHCATRYSGEKRGETFIIPNAYLHVVNEETLLLPGSSPNEAYVLFLEKGDKANDSVERLRLRDTVLNPLQGKTLYFVKSRSFFANAWLLKNLTSIALSSLAVLALGWWFIFDSRARLENIRNPMKVSEVVFCFSALILLIWMFVSSILQV